MAICNKYPEHFKIGCVKRYLYGEMKKDICEEFGLAKSIIWAWICKYFVLINREWEINPELLTTDENAEFIDIRLASEKAIKSSVVECKDNTIKIFDNGFAIVCTKKSFKDVMEMLSND